MVFDITFDEHECPPEYLKLVIMVTVFDCASAKFRDPLGQVMELLVFLRSAQQLR